MFTFIPYAPYYVIEEVITWYVVIFKQEVIVADL
jgi:hypothetical protein